MNETMNARLTTMDARLTAIEQNLKKHSEETVISFGMINERYVRSKIADSKRVEVF